MWLVTALPATAQPISVAPWMTGERLLKMVTFAPGSKGNFDLTPEQYLDAQRARFYIEGVHDKSEGKSWYYSARYQPGPDALLDNIYAGLRKLPRAQLKRNASDLITEIWAATWPCPDQRKASGAMQQRLLLGLTGRVVLAAEISPTLTNDTLSQRLAR